MSNLIRAKRNYSLISLNINKLLKQLGIPDEITKVTNFWRKYSKEEIGYIFNDAKILYKKRLVEISPRAEKDNENDAKNLNELFNHIEKRFNNHLNPILLPQNEPLLEEKLITCFCGCNEDFFKIRKNHKYLNRNCAQRARSKRRKLAVFEQKVAA